VSASRAQPFDLIDPNRSFDPVRTAELRSLVQSHHTWADLDDHVDQSGEFAHYESLSHVIGDGELGAGRTRRNHAIAHLPPSSFGRSAAWITDVFAADSQWAAYRTIADRSPQVMVQLGGRGSFTAEFLRAFPASRAVLISPISAELHYFSIVARELGVHERAGFVLARAERWPFHEASIDVVISAGSMHHVDLARCMPLIARSLTDDGLSVSWDIYGSPLYRVGIKLFGKHEPVRCTPLTDDDIALAVHHFTHAEVDYTGGFFRYPLGLLRRIGLIPRIRPALALLRIDRWMSRRLPLLRSSASIVYLCLRAPVRRGTLSAEAPSPHRVER
jgi:hypothetical protein